MDEPLELKEHARWCPHLLDVPWLNETLRRESYHLCIVGGHFGSHLSNITELKEIDRLVAEI